MGEYAGGTFEPSILRPCAAVGQEEEGGPMVKCERPGVLYIAQNGKTYALCFQHRKVFFADVDPIARNDGDEDWDGTHHGGPVTGSHDTGIELHIDGCGNPACDRTAHSNEQWRRCDIARREAAQSDGDARG